MRVKIQGYEGHIISIYAHEELKRYLAEKPEYTIVSYDITIRTDKSGAQITFKQVKPGAFEVMYP